MAVPRANGTSGNTNVQIQLEFIVAPGMEPGTMLETQV